MTDDTPRPSNAEPDSPPEPEPVPMPGYTVLAQEPPTPVAPAPVSPSALSEFAAPPALPETVPGGPDRVRVQFGWEAVLLLLVAAGVGGWWLLGRDTDLLRDPDLLVDRMFAVAPFLLLAAALAASIRVRAVNLAAGTVAALAALLFVSWEDESQWIAAGMVVAAVLAVTLALVLLVPVLRVPGWAASLGVAVAVLATVTTVAEDGGFEVGPSVGGALTTLPESATVTVAADLVWVVVGAVLAIPVLGGAIGLLPRIRRRLQDCREAGAAPDRRTQSTVLTTSAALLVSNLLAAGAGVLLVIPSERVAGGTLVPAGGFALIGIALPLAIVLLGGTSLWGRRGGVFGTLLAALALFAAYAAFADLGWTAQGHWLLVGALGLGLLVSWLVEALATRAPRPAASPPDLAAAPAMAEASGSAEPAESPDTATSSESETVPTLGDRHLL